MARKPKAEKLPGAPKKKTGGAKTKTKKEMRAEAAEAVKEHVAQAVLKMPEPRDLEHHYRQIKGFKEKAATANSHLRDARKKAKEAGINLAALDGILSYERMDEHEVREELSQLSAHLKIHGHPVQLTIFEAKNGTAEEEAYRVGRKHCELGKSSDSPYPEGSSADAEYTRGYSDMTAERLGVKPEDVAKAEGGNKAAGTRVRKTMQEIKATATQVRVKVLESRSTTP